MFLRKTGFLLTVLHQHFFLFLQKVYQSAALLLRPATRRAFAPPFTAFIGG